MDSDNKMKKLYLIFIILILCGCTDHDTQATMRQLEVDQKVQSGRIDEQNKKIEELKGKIQKLEKDFNTIPKWKL